MDPISLTTATITCIQTISSIYKKIEHLRGLPKAFQKVYEDLPLVQDTLSSASNELQLRVKSQEPLSADIRKSIETLAKRCHDKAEELRTIFYKIEVKHHEVENDKDWSVLEFYRDTLRTFGRMAKAHKVETLMQELLHELKKMSMVKVFQLATAAQVAKVDKAIEELATVEPSISDEEVEDGGALNVNQYNQPGARGNQAVNGGGHQENVFGYNWNVGGGTLNFVYSSDSDISGTRFYSNVPWVHLSPASFVGREELLKKVYYCFHLDFPSRESPVVLVLSGMGGRGKSRIALQYCYLREKSGCRYIFWVNALSEETTIRSFNEIAEIISKDTGSSTLPHRPVTWNTVTDELSAIKHSWVLVFDNHDDPTSFPNLSRFFPRRGNGSILVTTRHATLGQEHSWKQIEVPDMTETEALELLRQRSGQSNLTESDVAAGKQIVRMLGCLPMAINATGLHISGLDLNFLSYIHGFNKYKKEIFELIPPDYHREEKQNNWFATYEYSLSILPPAMKDMTIHLLTLSAFFGEALIQESFFKEYCRTQQVSQTCPSWLFYFTESCAWSTHKFRALIVELDRRGLIRFHRELPKATEANRDLKQPGGVQTGHQMPPRPHGGIQPNPTEVEYSLHPVIRDWLRFRPVAPPEKQASEAVAIIAAYLKETHISTMSRQTRLNIWTHIDTFIKDTSINNLNYGFGLHGPDDQTPSALLFSTFCREFSRLKIAKRLLTSLLKAREEAGIAEDNPRTAEVVLELAQTFSDNAEHSLAEERYAFVLKFSESIGRTLHCKALLGQAHTLCEQYKLVDAYTAVKKLCELVEDERGDDKAFLTLKAKLILARIEAAQGYPDRAGGLVDEVLRATITWSPTHDLVIDVKLMKVEDLMIKKQTSQGKKLLLETLKEIEDENGDDHRMVLNAYMLLGHVYGRTGQHDDARKYFKEAKSRAGSLFGDTPGDVDVEIMIGYTYLYDGMYDNAQRQFENALIMANTRPGFEMTVVRATIGLFQLYLARRELLKAIPLIWVVFRYFSFASALRSNKSIVLCSIAGIVLLVYYIFQGHLLATIFILGVVGPLVWR